MGYDLEIFSQKQIDSIVQRIKNKHKAVMGLQKVKNVYGE